MPGATNIYAGDPTHLKWNGNVLLVDNSDGSSDKKLHPVVATQLATDESERLSFFADADGASARLWLGKVANYIVYDSGSDQLKSGFLTDPYVRMGADQDVVGSQGSARLSFSTTFQLGTGSIHII